jgi:hypothetical protein
MIYTVSKKLLRLSLISIAILSSCSKPTIQPVPKPPQAQACTEEAKICPDGSAVGRTSPNCEFAPCPGQK